MSSRTMARTFSTSGFTLGVIPRSIASSIQLACQIEARRIAREKASPEDARGSPRCSGRGNSLAWLERSPALDGRGKRAFVEIVELAADRHTLRQARHRHTVTLQLFGEIVRRRLTLHGGVEGKQHLLDRWGCPRDDPHDVELFRSDTVERREVAAEHVVEGVDHAGPLERPQIGDFLDHHDEAAIAPRILADSTGADR